MHTAQTALPLNRYLVELTMPLDIWQAAEVFDEGKHIGWDAEPAGLVSMNWGTEWAKAGRTALARVPSVIVPEDVNVLINPLHRDVLKLKPHKVRRWIYDPRFAVRRR